MLKLHSILKQLTKQTASHQRADLCLRALALISREQDPTLWATLQKDLADSLVRDPSANRRKNLERAIEAYARAIDIWLPDKYPQQWAAAQNNLAVAYAQRIAGEPAENLEWAIAHYEWSLTVRTRVTLPEDWAQTQINLGNAYFDRLSGERAENLEEAILHYKQATEVYTSETFPRQWAAVQNNLATVYQNRIRGNRAENLEHAEHCFMAALTVRTREALPDEWATTQNNLSALYSEDGFGNRAENLEYAIERAEAALTVWSRKTQPRRWAAAHNNLAGAFVDRVVGHRAENIERAIHHYEQALTVRTRQALPNTWAGIQHNLSIAFRNRVRGVRAENIEHAIEHAQAALKFRTRKALPESWAVTQNAMAGAFLERVKGDRATNVEQAIGYAEAALNVLTPDAFPLAWAEVQNKLGLACESRIHGDRSDNLERAIYHYRQALQVYTPDTFPEAWSKTQYNLANAYSERLRDEHATDAGEPGDNFERAIHHYEQALTIQTREQFPRDWAMTHDQLGSTYANRFCGRREENLELAIQHLEAALTVRTRRELPEEWAETQNKLGGVFSRRIAGNRSENIELAIEHYREALRVRTRKGLPRAWAEVQHNLGLAHRDRIAGNRAGNLARAVRHLEAAAQVYARETFPAEHRIVQRNLGGLHLARGNWERAHVAFGSAIRADDDLLQAAYTDAGRHAELRETSRLHASDAYCLLRLEHPTEALLTLEQGKTRLLNEALSLGGPEFDALPKAKRKTVMTARQVVRGLEAELRLSDISSHRDQRQLVETLRRARVDLARHVEEVRTSSAISPLGRLKLSELLDLIPGNGALVAPMITSRGSSAFVVPHGAAALTREHVVMLDHFTDNDLLTLLLGSVSDTAPGRGDAIDLGGWLGGYAKRTNDWVGWLAAIEDTGRRLWDGVIGPIHGRLRSLGLLEGAPVLIIPQGGLGLLPLHAAWRVTDGGQRRYFLDDYTTIYAPSCYALWAGNQRLSEPQRERPSLIAVLDPTGNLPHAALECQAVLELFEPFAREALVGSEATREAVVRAVRGRSYIHFACHGSYAWGHDVMQSGLELAGGRLSLADVVSDLELRAARLAVLSACETGLIDIRQSPDEHIGLPTAFLQAGTPAVVSTLWSVNDLSTRLLIERFYRSHLEDHLVPAAALRRAQIWLRDGTAGEMSLADQWRQMYRVAADQEVKKMAFSNYRYFERHPQVKPFTSPYFWASFTFTGGQTTGLVAQHSDFARLSSGPA
jgi:CHAT domain-containing protein/tetratricopeptide (TPR) repeat protein